MYSPFSDSKGRPLTIEKVKFSHLSQLVDCDEGHHVEYKLLLEDGGKVKNYSLFPDNENRRFAVYYLELDVGSFWQSEPHLKGTTEFITIFTGRIEIHSGGQSFVVERGESIRFRADTIHSYKNVGNETAILHMILFNP